MTLYKHSTTENNNNWRKNNKETYVHLMITFQLIQTISHITSQRSEKNIFNNIFIDKFKARVTLTKSNSDIVKIFQYQYLSIIITISATLHSTYLGNALKSTIYNKCLNTFESYNFRAYSNQMKNPCYITPKI